MKMQLRHLLQFTLCTILLSLVPCRAADRKLEPPPGPSPPESPVPVMPQSDPADEPNVPALLPESDVLPVKKDSDSSTKSGLSSPPSASAGKGTGHSARATEEARKHLEKIRILAMESPHAVYLLKRAHHAKTRKARRRYLLAYRSVIRSRMHSLDPDLSVSTVDLEETQEKSQPPSKKAAKKHRIQHRVHHNRPHVRHRHRYIEDDDDEGPPMGPYYYPPGPYFGPGPYGFPGPYGPP